MAVYVVLIRDLWKRVHPVVVVVINEIIEEEQGLVPQE